MGHTILPGMAYRVHATRSRFGAWFGWKPLIATPASLAFTSPAQLLYYLLIGLLCGLIGLLYARGFYGITHQFHTFPLPRWLKPAIGGLCVGLIGLVMPEALGMGYGWLQISIGPGLLGIPLWVILLLPFAKIITTGLSIGSGGSGGIFGPGMVIETTIESNMQLAGHELREAILPQQCLVVSIRRQQELIFPGDTAVIEPGDIVTFLVGPEGELPLHKYL